MTILPDFVSRAQPSHLNPVCISLVNNSYWNYPTFLTEDKWREIGLQANNPVYQNVVFPTVTSVQSHDMTAREQLRKAYHFMERTLLESPDLCAKFYEVHAMCLRDQGEKALDKRHGLKRARNLFIDDKPKSASSSQEHLTAEAQAMGMDKRTKRLKSATETTSKQNKVTKKGKHKD